MIVDHAASCAPSREAIEALLPHFTGEIQQMPPAYSAIKVDGNRAYDLARAGEMVVLEARPVQIDALTLIDMPDRDTAVFEARCGKGTYVRALARDMGRELGCLGHLIALRRTRVAPFDEARGGDPRRRCRSAAEHGRARPCTRLLLPIEAALQDAGRDQRRPERCRPPAARAGRADPRARCAHRRRRHLRHLQGPA